VAFSVVSQKFFQVKLLLLETLLHEGGVA